MAGWEVCLGARPLQEKTPSPEHLGAGPLGKKREGVGLDTGSLEINGAF